MAYFIAKDVRIFGEKPNLRNLILDFIDSKNRSKISRSLRTSIALRINL